MRAARTVAHLGLALGVATALLGFLIDRDAVYFGGVAVLLVAAVARMVIEVTWPNPKDAPGPRLPSLEDRKRWSEAPLASAWPEHQLCDRCQGAKLCPSCGGDGGCADCGGQAWCAECGGAGQWPVDPQRSIYTPSPAAHRS